MIERITLLAGMALAAVAVMAPAAQANVTLSDTSGGTLKAGAKVTATSTNLVLTRHNKTMITCEKKTLHFELVDPGPTHVELEQLGEATTSGCVLDRSEIGLSNLSITMDDNTVGVGENSIMTIDTWGTGVTNTSRRSTIFGDAEHKVLVADCTFSGSAHFQATPQPTDELSVAGTFNGPCGEITMHGEFTLETTNGEQVFINYQAT